MAIGGARKDEGTLEVAVLAGTLQKKKNRVSKRADRSPKGDGKNGFTATSSTYSVQRPRDNICCHCQCELHNQQQCAREPNQNRRATCSSKQKKKEGKGIIPSFLRQQTKRLVV